MGRILATRPRLYLLDEPTKGIDIAAKRGILATTRSVLAGGCRGGAHVSRGRRPPGSLRPYPGSAPGRIVAAYGGAEFDESRIYMAMQGLGSNG